MGSPPTSHRRAAALVTKIEIADNFSSCSSVHRDSLWFTHKTSLSDTRFQSTELEKWLYNVQPCSSLETKIQGILRKRRVHRRQPPDFFEITD